jgi:hypothetical protein
VRPVTIAAAALALVLAGSAPAAASVLAPGDPGDPADPTDCGSRPVASQIPLDWSTGNLDLCVFGDVTIVAPGGTPGDLLETFPQTVFSWTDPGFALSDTFLPPPDTPVVATILGDAVIDWGAFRSQVRLVATGDIAVVVPEPGTLSLVLLGLSSLAVARPRVRG